MVRISVSFHVRTTGTVQKLRNASVKASASHLHIEISTDALMLGTGTSKMNPILGGDRKTI